MNSKLLRVAPLAGLAYAILTVAGDLAIGDFPRGDTDSVQLATYYAAHHGAVALGGTLPAMGAVFLALFGTALWARLGNNPNNRFAGGVVLVGTALAAMTAIQSAGTYVVVGEFATNPVLAPAAMQALHVLAAELWVGSGLFVLLLGVLAAWATARAVPGWLAWIGLAIGVGALTPVGFTVSLLFLLWAAIAAIVLTVRRPTMVPAASTEIPLPA